MSRDEFLDRLFDRLAGSGGPGRRVLTEVEGHLEDGVTDGVARGLSPEAAEAETLARLGTPD
ncbi:MAG TPA: permease prefix domain 1-containing protein, partial [Sporichthya sp.]|nr:permease prefix domain 1-containing protein [Sporichthya sp.]